MHIRFPCLLIRLHSLSRLMDSYEVLLNPLQYVADDSKKGKAFLQSSLAILSSWRNSSFVISRRTGESFQVFLDTSYRDSLTRQLAESIPCLLLIPSEIQIHRYSLTLEEPFTTSAFPKHRHMKINGLG